ncbi:MAG: site-specific DNA-methyltransferase, partial [Bauldia sp.]|nr:site-specific DNA-methyltransferase [Bauldia sp.]
IAAEMTGRSCHAIELNPAYVDVAIRRWQDFTGEEAVLEGSGSSFLAVARERGVDQSGTPDRQCQTRIGEAELPGNDKGSFRLALDNVGEEA